MRRCWPTLRWSRRQRLRFIVTGKSRCGRLRKSAGGTGCDCGGVGAKKRIDCSCDAAGRGVWAKSFPDFAVEAAVLAKKTGKPVKWFGPARDDIRFDSYHSVSAIT